MYEQATTDSDTFRSTLFDAKQHLIQPPQAGVDKKKVSADG